MASPFSRLPDELISNILILVHLHAPFFTPPSPSCRCSLCVTIPPIMDNVSDEKQPNDGYGCGWTHQASPSQRPTLAALNALLSISHSILVVALSTPHLFTSLELKLGLFPNTNSDSPPYDGELMSMGPKIEKFFSRSGKSLPLTLRLRAMDWEEWYEGSLGHSYADRAVYLRSSPDTNDMVLVPLAFIYNPLKIPPEVPFTAESMLPLRRQYFHAITHRIQQFISDLILNPCFQSRWEFLQLEIPVHFGFHDLLGSLVADEGCSEVRTTPAWPALRTLRLAASYEDSSLTPAKGAATLFTGGRSVHAPNLKDLRLDLKTVVNPASIAPAPDASNPELPFSLASLQLTSSSSAITRLRLDTYTTTSQLHSILSRTPVLEMCDVRLHADVMDDEEMDVGVGATVPPHVGLVPLPPSFSAGTTKTRGRMLLPRLTYLAIRSAYHLDILNRLCVPALKGLYVEMESDVEELDADWWEEDFGHGLSNQGADEGDDNAPIQYQIPTTNGESTSGEILEAFVHACSAAAPSSDPQTGLRYLKLVSVPVSDSSIIHILRLTPQLRELRVWCGPAGRFIDELLPVSALCDYSTMFGKLRYVERHPNYPQQHYPRSRLQRATTFVPYLTYLSVNILPRRRDQVVNLKERLDRLILTRGAAFMEYAMHMQVDAHEQEFSELLPEMIAPLNFAMIQFDEQPLNLERVDTEMPEFECSMWDYML